MKHFAKLSEEEKLQDIAFGKWRTEMDYRLDRSGWIEYGEKRGLEKGREEGREEQNKEFVLKLLKEGTELAFISKVTGLSEKEILKIKNKKL